MKNVPLLLVMSIIGSSTLVIALTTSPPQFVKSILLIVAAFLNVWSMIGLILHLGIQKLRKNDM